MPLALDIVPEQGRAVATAALNIRMGEPNTRAEVSRTVPAGAPLVYTGRTDSGERVNGNSRWFRDPDGNFFWSGGVRLTAGPSASSPAGNPAGGSGAALLPRALPPGGDAARQAATVALLDILKNFLPPPAPPLPAPGVSVIGLEEKAVGIGNRRGIEVRGSFAVAELKGIRLDARLRFQLWAAGVAEIAAATADLSERLMRSRDQLWADGVLRLDLDSVSPEDSVAALGGWRQSADYRVLYEYRYADSDGAESLIARIPVASDLEAENSPERETTVVTDDMVRWDNEAAPALTVRGPRGIAGLESLAFVTAAAPAGAVVLARTFDGAAGPPAAHADLASFLAAVAGDAAAERHAQVAFASLADFLAAFSAAGAPVGLGDWDLDGVPDPYAAGVLVADPAIRLPHAVDRFEIAYQNAALDQAAVVYLRVIRG